MPKQNAQLLAFNRGVISPLGLARIDVDRLPWSAEIQTNWMPRLLGSMSLRPGSEYIGPTRDNAFAVHIPFVFATDDTAIIELTDNCMRVRIDEEIITRPTVATTVTNGNFTSNISGWTDNDESGATSSWHASGFAQLLGDGTNAAILEQLVTVTGDENTEHALNIVVYRGPVVLKVGSTSSGDDYVSETTLGTGTHSLAFTPTNDFYVEISNRLNRIVLVNSITIEAAGEMELVTPWGLTQLRSIRSRQSADVFYLTCRNEQQRKIERRGTRSWSIVLYEPEDGPFRVQNVSGVTIAASALTGNITLTASAALFREEHIGGLFKIISTGQNVVDTITGDNQFTDSVRVIGVGDSRKFTIVRSGTWVATVTLQRSFDEGATWENVTTYTTNATTVYDDNLDNQEIYYRLGVETGNYTSGTVEISISYSLGSNTGIVRITDYNTALSVNAEVLNALGNTTATTEWAEGGWSDYRGYPTAVALDEGRLSFSGIGKFIASVSDAYESFDDSVEGDSAPINKTIGYGPIDSVNWMLDLSRILLGTQGSEKSIRSSSFEEPLTPTNCNIKDISTFGSSDVAAIKVDKRGIFVSGPSVYELSYDVGSSDYVTNKLSKLCPELMEPYIVGLAVQRTPDTRIHCIRSDGKVAILVDDPNEDLRGWILYETDGQVEDIFVMKGLETDLEDKVYYCVKRTINGATVRYLERWSLESECRGETVSKNLDSHLVYSGASTTTITGLDHLEGELVYVWGAGKDLGTYTVVSGSITLSEAVTSATIGLTYQARYKSTKLAYAAGLGTALNQRKKLGTFGLVMRNTHYQGLTYGPSFDYMDNLPLVEQGAVTTAHTVWEDYDFDMMTFPGEWSTDSRLCLEANAPRPCTVLACVLGIQTNDKG